MTGIEKLKEMAKVGQKIEIELKTKEAAFYAGIIKESGDDYLIIEDQRQAEIKSKDAEGNEDSYTEIYKISTLIFLNDIRALSIVDKR